MARRWWKSGRLKGDEELVEAGSTIHHDKRWKFKMIVNGFGAVTTFHSHDRFWCHKIQGWCLDYCTS